MKSSFLHLLKDVFKDLAGILFPRMCIVCGKRLQSQENYVCTECLLRLPYTFYRGKAENDVVRLFYGRVNIGRGSAFLFYHPGSDSRKILFALKYQGMARVGFLFGRMMAEDLLDTGFFEEMDALIPVPLAPRRQHSRGYNQSEWIARGIADVTGLPVWADVVERTVENATQTHLSHEERYRNVEGIFRCIHPERLQGKHILVIDDVVTTGATLSSCIHSMETVTDARFSMLALAQAASQASIPGHTVKGFDI